MTTPDRRPWISDRQRPRQIAALIRAGHTRTEAEAMIAEHFRTYTAWPEAPWWKEVAG